MLEVVDWQEALEWENDTSWKQGLSENQLDEVRQIAIQTQVPINSFIECPNCGESMFDGFLMDDVETPSIDFHCEECGAFGTLLDNGAVKYDSPPRN